MKRKAPTPPAITTMIRTMIIVFDPFSSGTDESIGSAVSNTSASAFTLVFGTGSTFLSSITFSSDLVTDSSGLALGSAFGSAAGSAAGSAFGSTTGSAFGSTTGSDVSAAGSSAALAAGSSYKFINPYAYASLLAIYSFYCKRNSVPKLIS